MDIAGSITLIATVLIRAGLRFMAVGANTATTLDRWCYHSVGGFLSHWNAVKMHPADTPTSLSGKHLRLYRLFFVFCFLFFVVHKEKKKSTELA
jgi:hypothetical protein